MSTFPSPSSASTTVAALHQIGGSWRAVAASLSSDRLRILDAREFTGSESGRIEAWLEQQGVTRVIGVLPGGSVICRTAQLPNGSDPQLAAALRLQAESHLLGAMPDHRVSMAVLQGAAGEENRCGLVLSWPEEAQVRFPTLSQPTTFASDVCGLAALLNGHRPADPLLWIDRRDGSVVLAMTHLHGVAFRSVREEADSVSAWQQAVDRLIAETALSVGHPGSYIDQIVRHIDAKLGDVALDDSTLLIPDEVMSSLHDRIDGAARDSTWWSTYGVAAGVLLASTNALAPLTTMRMHAPRVKPSPGQRLVNLLSSQRTATYAAIFCIAVLIASPLLFSYGRLKLLELRHPDIDADLKRVTEVERKLNVYDALEDNAWCMSKLLADIACNVPLGVEVEAVTLNTNRNITVQGRTVQKTEAERALSREGTLAKMQKQMLDSGIFEKVSMSADDIKDSSELHFRLDAQVRNAHYQYEYPIEQDFGARPLAAFMYPDAFLEEGGRLRVKTQREMWGDDASAGAASTAVAVSDDDDPTLVATGGGDEGSASTAPPTAPSTAEAGGSGAVTRTPSARNPGVRSRNNLPGGPAGAMPEHLKIPDPITADEVGRMSLDEAQAAALRVIRAKRRTDIEDDVKDRLESEWELLKEHMRELRSGGEET